MSKKNELPEQCAARHPLDQSPIMIFKSEAAFYPLHETFDVDLWNTLNGVTEAMVKAMLEIVAPGLEDPASKPA